MGNFNFVLILASLIKNIALNNATINVTKYTQRLVFLFF